MATSKAHKNGKVTMSEPVHMSVPLKRIMKQILETAQMTNASTATEKSPYISPKELAERWACSRSSVDRIARRIGLQRLCIGQGKNGTVRYLRTEVIAYEEESLVATA